MKMPKMVLFDYGQTNIICRQSRYGPKQIPNTMFTPYLYESPGIEIALSNSEIDTVFWNAAAPGVPTEGIKDFLEEGHSIDKNILTVTAWEELKLRMEE